MLMQLKAPLVAGASFPVQFQFEKAGSVTAQFKVESIQASMHEKP